MFALHKANSLNFLSTSHYIVSNNYFTNHFRTPNRSVWQSIQGNLQAKKIDFNSIPVVDVSPLIGSTSTNNEKLKATIDCLREACRSVGFFYIKNHGVTDEQLNKTFKAA